MKELMTVQKRMNRLFETALARTEFDTPDGVHTWMPLCDVVETPAATLLRLELPGFQQERIELRIEGDELIVSGERSIDREEPGQHFHRVERPYGKFARRFHLPSGVDRDAVEATYRDGVLDVSLPRRESRSTDSLRVTIR